MRETIEGTERIKYMPADSKIQSLLERFVHETKSALKENLAGIYLHGSLAMGCFNEKKSDVDLIVVVYHPLLMEEKRAYLEKILMLNEDAPAKGIEMSVVLKRDMNPFVHPAPFEMHFSNAHLEACKSDPEGALRRLTGTDRDLAAHVTIIRQYGKTLYGEEIPGVFSSVSHEDYLDALMYDLESAEEDISENPMYMTFSLCRVLAYVRDRKVLSKKDGASWAILNVKKEYHEIIREAQHAYETDAEMKLNDNEAKAFAKDILSQIRESIFQ